MDSLHILVEQGKVLYLGASDLPAWVVSAANMYARENGKTEFVIYQGRWNCMMWVIAAMPSRVDDNTDIQSAVATLRGTSSRWHAMNRWHLRRGTPSAAAVSRARSRSVRRN